MRHPFTREACLLCAALGDGKSSMFVAVESMWHGWRRHSAPRDFEIMNTHFPVAKHNWSSKWRTQWGYYSPGGLEMLGLEDRVLARL
jgi:hypothetical protein